MTSRSLGRRCVLLALLPVTLVASPASPAAAAAAGDLDPTFAGDGTLVEDVQGAAREVLAQADGRVTVGGLAAGDFFLARYTAAGARDPLFNDGRPAEAAAAGVRAVAGLGRDAAGNLLVAGTTTDDGYAVARYKPNGTLDRTYGTAGVASGAELASGVNDVVALPDGRVVLVGDVDLGGGDVIAALIRLTADGAFDPTFGTDGFAALDQRAYAATADAGGFVVSGSSTVRVSGDGDTVTPLPGSGFTADDVVADGARGALLVGAGLRVRRQPTSGAAGQAFGPAAPFADAAGGKAAVDADGRVLVAGKTTADFAVARYLPTGAPDPAFGGDGVVTTDLTGGADASAAVAVQAGGAVLVAGSAGGRVAVARYLGAATAPADPAAADPGSGTSTTATAEPSPGTAAPQQEVLGETASAAAFGLRRGQTLRVAGKALSFAMTCPAAGCAAVRFKVRLLKGSRTLWTTKARSATRKAGRLTLRLDRRALALLKRHGRLRAVLVAVGPEGSVTSPRLTLALRGARR